ncbi:helix-turn-helix domain-containing protein [Microbacterium oxydans]|uniref:helix-turn-helix domain-containing protein n=1 Tax=Microbacterium oxydans TaxID=82380 RepID=UPI00362DB6E8
MTADPAERIREAVAQLEKWHAERDAAIRAAANGEPKLSPTDIARASGMSRMQVYRILAEKADGSSA